MTFANQLLYGDSVTDDFPDAGADQRMNYYSHRATWARLSNDFNAARQWISELLALNPGSGVGYTHMGRVAQAEGKCPEAIENWQRAIDIYAADGDPEEYNTGKIGRPHAIENLRSLIRRCR
jgi:hypothetical protein